MDTTKVFLAGRSSKVILRGIYKHGEHYVLGKWAQKHGLVSTEADGLISTTASVAIGAAGAAGTVSAAGAASAASAATNEAGAPALLDAATHTSQIKETLASAGLSATVGGEPVDLLFGKMSSRPKTAELSCTLWTTPLPDHAFIPVTDDLFVASPALAFVLNASELGLAKTIKYGCELCGRYSTDDSERGMNDHAPFASASAIRGFAAACCRGKGTHIARVAAKWIVDGFRSPKECDLYQLIVLPRDYGGYGFRRRPEVNATIVVDERLRSIAGVDKYEVDLLWRRLRVVVEYDGSDHEDARQAERDHVKDVVLREMGYTVIRINRETLGSSVRFDGEVRFLAEKVGERLPAYSAEWGAKRDALRKALFGEI